MKIKYRHFPHPVLSHFSNDFKKGNFNSEIEVIDLDGAYKIKTEFNLDEEVLNKYLKENRLELAVHIECPLTFFRTLKTTNKGKLNFDIPARFLEGKVEVVSLVIAKTDINDYSSNNFSEIFKKYSFNLNKGDIIAVGDQIDFEAYRDMDSIKNNPSIFQVVANKKSKPSALDLDLGGDKIIISLGEKYFERYKELKKNQELHSVLASMIVVPILVEIIEKFRNDDGEKVANSESYRWFRSLNNRFKAIGLNLKEPDSFEQRSVAIAQELVDRYLEKALNDLKTREEMITEYNIT